MSTILTGTYPMQHGIRDNGPYQLAGSWVTLAEILEGAGYQTAAFVSAAVLDPVHNLTQGFGVYDADVTVPYEPYDPLLVPTRDDIQGIERRAEVTVDRALEYLRGHEPGDVFLMVHLFDPHLPRDPPPPFDELYAGRPYEGEVAYTDQEIGRLLSGIEDLWQGDDITTLFVADHGEGLGDHGEWLHGDLIYEPTMRVPLIVKGPGLPEGRRVPDLVRTVDLFPTICALAGIDLPDVSVGRPLSELGLEPRRPLDISRRLLETAYMETFRPRLTHGWCEMRGLRTDRWKLIDGPRYELYDLLSDPGETRDLAEVEPAVRDSLASLLDRLALLAARRGIARADDFEMDEEQTEKLMSLGYVTPRRSRLPAADGSSGLSADSLAVWLYPPEARGKALGLADPAERVGAAQDRIVARSFYKSAVALMESGNFSEAAARFRAAFEKRPDFADAYLGFFDAAMGAGQREAAYQCLRVATEVLPADARIAARLAHLLWDAGRQREADRTLDTALEAGAPDSLIEAVRTEIHEPTD